MLPTTIKMHGMHFTNSYGSQLTEVAGTHKLTLPTTTGLTTSRVTSRTDNFTLGTKSLAQK